MKRFARLSTGFSKKIENHAHAVALHYMHYNFAHGRVLRVFTRRSARLPLRLLALHRHRSTVEIADIVTLLDSKSVAA